jgi:NAD-dependent dihydropyrimidine dehydrogenase PreA subunit
MADEIYYRLAKVLDTLPNGFPSTKDGIEIRLLKKIFTPEEADLFCDLRLKFETPEKIAKRTGRPLEGLEEMLTRMWRERGEVFGVDLGGVKIFKMIPWVMGIYEFQLNRMDKELAELCEKYNMAFFSQFFKNKPQFMQVLPIEKDISSDQQILAYEQVSTIIENGQSFAVAECVCKKEQGLLGKTCKKPTEVCMSIAPVPGIFDNSHWGRAISKEEAYEVLRKAEEAGLVHLTYNVKQGHFFICNCCECCCGVIRAINLLGAKEAVNSHFYAEINPDECTSCGLCKDERCQVNAIKEGDDAYEVIKEKCIGCGLCISTCPTEAIKLIRKPAAEITPPVDDEKAWFEERGKIRGVDFSKYK